MKNVDSKDVDGIILLGGWYRVGEKYRKEDVERQLLEATRTFPDTKLVIQLPVDTDIQSDIIESTKDRQVTLLLPPIRMLEQLHDTKKRVETQTLGGIIQFNPPYTLTG